MGVFYAKENTSLALDIIEHVLEGRRGGKGSHALIYLMLGGDSQKGSRRLHHVTTMGEIGSIEIVPLLIAAFEHLFVLKL